MRNSNKGSLMQNVIPVCESNPRIRLIVFNLWAYCLKNLVVDKKSIKYFNSSLRLIHFS